MENIKNKSQNQTEYIKQLEETCLSQKKHIEMLENKIDWMIEQIKLSQHKRFGASSEKSEYDQLGFFNEAEKEADNHVAEPELEEIKYKRKKRAGKKQEMLSDLPVETIEYYLSEEEQSCPECGDSLHIMGRDIRRELKERLIMKTISNLNELLTNIKTLDGYLYSKVDPEYDFALNLI